MRAFAWGFFSLREAVAGMSPRRATFFLCFAKERRQRKATPTGAVRLGPDCSAVLGVWGLAPNSLRGLRPLRSDSRAKSVDEACCARGPKPLRSSTPPTGPEEQYGRLLRKHSLSTPRFASAPGRAAARSVIETMRSETSGGVLRTGVPWSGSIRRRQVAEGSIRSGTAKWRASLLWLLSFDATNESDPPAGAESRRTRRQAEETHTRSGKHNRQSQKNQ